MDPIARTIAVLTILFLASFTGSAFGFGDALLAMPLLTLAVGLPTAVPLVRLAGSTMSIGILAGAWHRVDLHAAWRLIVASIVGVPLGVLLLQLAPAGIVTAILAVVLIAYGIANLTTLPLPTLESERMSYLFGFVAGILGGAYNTNGPPIVMYGVMRGWSPKRFRATLQGYFLPTGFAVLVGQALAGFYTREIWQLYAYSLPVIGTAVLAGGWVNRRFEAEQFERIVYALLVAIGVVLLISR